jgi:hypothetical protein
MGFFTWKTASKHDPIFSGRFVVSSKSHSKKADEEKYFKGGWAKEDDPIYKQGWTIAPNMSGRPQMIGRS